MPSSLIKAAIGAVLAVSAWGQVSSYPSGGGGGGGGGGTTTSACEPGIGDGTNAISAGTYLSSTCYNTGSTVTITGIRCFSDNNGTSTMNVTNGTGTALLTAPITCTAAFAAGTQGATVTIAQGDFLKFTYIADGTSKQMTGVIGFGSASTACEPGIGDGTNAMTAATYLSSTCYNTGDTLTITGIKCFSDNNGTSTMNVTNGTGTALLTGPVTCTTAFAAGTQGATVTLAQGDFLKFTYVTDGTTKQLTGVVGVTR